jgi:glycosyltransferase involved in cell wall biosynthesis
MMFAETSQTPLRGRPGTAYAPRSTAQPHARPPAPLLSAIVACYKDAEAIPHMATRLRQTFEKIGCRFEIIFVNDCSPDSSQAILEALAAQDARIKIIAHSRNFGSQSAFTSGLMRASGDACILLDGDLQDPPELIEAFYAKWQQGDDVVYGVRTQRDMRWGLEFFYKAFYRLFGRLAYVRIPVDAGDFSLLDRRVVQALNSLPERDRFVRGLRAWVGFVQSGVPYRRPERMFGRSTNNFIANLRWARKAIFSFTYVPLELISAGALGVSFLSVLVMVYQIIDRIRRPELPWGISTIVVVLLFLGSVQLMSLAFIAEYIGKIFEEVKMRPRFIVDTLTNFDGVAPPAENLSGRMKPGTAVSQPFGGPRGS